MTRLYLAAGVAALAIAVPATAGPGGHGGGGGQRPERAQTVQQRGGGAARVQRTKTAQAPRPQRAERVAAAARPARTERVQMRAERQQVRATRIEQAQTRQQVHASRVEQAQARQQARASRTEQARTRAVNREQVQANRTAQVQNRAVQRQQLQANRALAAQNRVTAQQQIQASRTVAVQNRVAARSALATQRLDRVRAFTPVPATLTTQTTRIIPVGEAVRVVGQPVSAVSSVVTLAAMPAAVSYLYPDTPDYYYQYGGGYAYQIDRSTSLIAALIPLLAGGYMPGQYLPASYMTSYAPDYYGLNSFYPASNPFLCNRYVNGVVYQVDCITGMVENVIPLYASGYGVGQLLPSAYDNYNVPYQYRSLYPESASTGYWYAPGAIYQYDPSSSLITSVASLLSPGFAVGQPLPMGYSAYNVPYDYRQTYYDTPTAMYRYNNGYIYQVDPSTLLVSAIVASILT